jgi:hypothetical protein
MNLFAQLHHPRDPVVYNLQKYDAVIFTGDKDKMSGGSLQHLHPTTRFGRQRVDRNRTRNG